MQNENQAFKMMLKIFTFLLFLQNHDNKNKIFLMKAAFKCNQLKVKNFMIKGICYNEKVIDITKIKQVLW